MIQTCDPLLPGLLVVTSLLDQRTVAGTNLPPPGLAQGLAQGLTPGLAQGLTQGLTPGLTHGLTQGLTPGLTHGLTHGLTQGLTPGLTHGLTHGLTQGLTPGLTQEQDGLDSSTVWQTVQKKSFASFSYRPSKAIHRQFWTSSK